MVGQRVAHTRWMGGGGGGWGATCGTFGGTGLQGPFMVWSHLTMTMQCGSTCWLVVGGWVGAS